MSSQIYLVIIKTKKPRNVHTAKQDAYNKGDMRMTYPAIRRKKMERKIISISQKRQITIPKEYFNFLNFGNEAECILQNNSIVIRPIRENYGSEFSEHILADLIADGYAGQELLAKFKSENKKLTSAIGLLIDEADKIAKGEKKSVNMKDIFETEYK